jgi:hypothetical protein
VSRDSVSTLCDRIVDERVLRRAIVQLDARVTRCVRMQCGVVVIRCGCEWVGVGVLCECSWI